MLNLLINGHFSRALYQWTGDGTIDRAQGYPRLNAVKLEAGQTLSQAIGIAPESYYTLHYFYKLATGATLTVGYGSVTQEHTGAPLDVWREGLLAFAVEEGEGNGSVFISAAGGVAYVDTIALLAGALPITRAQLANAIAARIPTLAAEKELVTTPNASGPEGSYSAGIDEALRQLGAVTSWGDPDITLLPANKVNDATQAALNATLQLLRGMFALDVDVTLGPRSESLSQRAESLDRMLPGGAGAADRGVKMGTLYRDNTGWQR